MATGLSEEEKRKRAEKKHYSRPDPNTPGVQTLTPVLTQAAASRKALNPSGRGETHPTAIAQTIPGVIHNAANVEGAGISAFDYQVFAKRRESGIRDSERNVQEGSLKAKYDAQGGMGPATSHRGGGLFDQINAWRGSKIGPPVPSWIRRPFGSRDPAATGGDTAAPEGDTAAPEGDTAAPSVASFTSPLPVEQAIHGGSLYSTFMDDYDSFGRNIASANTIGEMGQLSGALDDFNDAFDLGKPKKPRNPWEGIA